MFRWRFYLITTAAFALPFSGLWLNAWHISVGLRWLEPEPDMLLISALSIAASAFLAALVMKAPTKS